MTRGSETRVTRCRFLMCIIQGFNGLLVGLVSAGRGICQHLSMLTAEEDPWSALPVSPSGVCGLGQPRHAAYPRLAKDGEAPDGSPPSLARPGRARRKAESATDRTIDECIPIDGFRFAPFTTRPRSLRQLRGRPRDAAGFTRPHPRGKTGEGPAAPPAVKDH